MATYVKFQRGTMAAYNALSVKDPNTLYFVYPEDDNSVGALYLGNMSISSSDAVITQASVATLTDVIVNSTGAGSFLVLNDAGKWVYTSAEDVAAGILDNLKINSNVFAYNSNNELTLYGFEDAEEGAQLVIGADGKISWVVPSAETVEGLQTTVETLKKDVVDLNTALDNKADAENVYTKAQTESAIANAIANVPHLKREIVSSWPEGEAIDVNTIYMIAKEGSEGDVYDEYIYINNTWEKIGDTSVSLEGYVTEDTLESTLENYATIEGLNAVNTALAGKVDAIEGYTLLSPVQAETLTKVSDGEFENYIKAVDTNVFTVNNSTLELKAVPASALNGVLGDLSSLVNTAEESTTVVDAIKEIYNILEWASMDEPTV